MPQKWTGWPLIYRNSLICSWEQVKGKTKTISQLQSNERLFSNFHSHCEKKLRFPSRQFKYCERSYCFLKYKMCRKALNLLLHPILVGYSESSSRFWIIEVGCKRKSNKLFGQYLHQNVRLPSNKILPHPKQAIEILLLTFSVFLAVDFVQRRLKTQGNS